MNKNNDYEDMLTDSSLAEMRRSGRPKLLRLHFIKKLIDVFFTNNLRNGTEWNYVTKPIHKTRKHLPCHYQQTSLGNLSRPFSCCCNLLQKEIGTIIITCSFLTTDQEHRIVKVYERGKAIFWSIGGGGHFCDMLRENVQITLSIRETFALVRPKID